MFASIDIPTLAVVNLMFLLLIVCSQILNRCLHPEIPGVVCWTWSSIFSSLGMYLLLLGRERLPSFLILLGHGLILLGYALSFVGFRYYMGRSLQRLPFLFGGLFLLFFGASAFFTYVNPLSEMRSMLGFGAIAMLTFGMAREMFRPSEETALVPRILGGMFGVHVFFNLFLVAFFLGCFEDVRFFDAPNVRRMLYLEALGFMFFLNTGYLFLTGGRLSERLKVQAETDSLTGIYNGQAFFRRGEDLIIQARKENEPLCFVEMDIDHFKQVNDTFGHPAGDAVLQGFTEHVRRGLPPQGLFGRMGGEEFAFLMKGFSVLGGVSWAEKVRKSLEEAVFAVSGREIRITASFGISCIELGEEDKDLPRLYREADEALYRAKKEGRNRVCRFFRNSK